MLWPVVPVDTLRKVWGIIRTFLWVWILTKLRQHQRNRSYWALAYRIISLSLYLFDSVVMGEGPRSSTPVQRGPTAKRKTDRLFKMYFLHFRICSLVWNVIFQIKLFPWFRRNVKISAFSSHHHHHHHCARGAHSHTYVLIQNRCSNVIHSSPTLALALVACLHLQALLWA